jgi:thiazole synthase
MRVNVNQESHEFADETLTVATFVEVNQLPVKSVVIAINGEIIPHSRWNDVRLKDGDDVEIVRAVAGGDHDPLFIAGHIFSSRLFLGTGKYPDNDSMRASLEASGTEMVTVAIRYMNLSDLGTNGGSILDAIDLSQYKLLPNTAGAYTVADAVKMARLARAATGTNWIKLEVIGDAGTLWPDVAGTIEATRILVDEGFVVLPYTSPDLVAAKRLEEAGAATVMPLASPIGSGLGMQDWASIERIVNAVSVPVVVDAGIGVPSDAALAMELGAAAVLVNTAVARALHPAQMALAMRRGVEAGRLAWLAGRMPKSPTAVASSPKTGVPLATVGAERIE